ESGFYFFNARFYDPGIARFTSADTLIPDEYNSQAWNRFAYVYNNPIGAKDPTGHAPQDENAGFKDASKNIANGFVEGVKTTLSAPTPVNAVVNSAVATGKGAKELYDNRKEVYASAKDFAGKLTSKDDKVRDYAVGQAKAYTMSAVLGGAASKALGSRLPKPNVNVPNGASSGYRYVTKGEVQAIKDTGMLRGGNPGETYFTKDLYKSGAKAQERLSLKDQPTHRVEFEVKGSPGYEKYGSKVKPDYGQPGKGSEFMTTNPVKVKLINVQPLK
ncbi:polymorphic toxin type 10 domain-containing protein, partial [Leptospira interrogans]